jgi:hypothetical protein
LGLKIPFPWFGGPMLTGYIEETYWLLHVKILYYTSKITHWGPRQCLRTGLKNLANRCGGRVCKFRSVFDLFWSGFAQIRSVSFSFVFQTIFFL